MKISIIVAAGHNNEIGHENRLLWRLPGDLKQFRDLTTGHVVVMGRKTFESLPNGALPNRINVVITRDKSLQLNNCVVLHSLNEALVRFNSEDEIFIIGGASIYEQALPVADTVFLTRVHAAYPEADAFFPEINPEEWKIINTKLFPDSETNPHSYVCYEYERQVL